MRCNLTVKAGYDITWSSWIDVIGSSSVVFQSWSSGFNVLVPFFFLIFFFLIFGFTSTLIYISFVLDEA